MKDKALAERELSSPKPAIVVADLPPQPEVIEEVVEESKEDVLSCPNCSRRFTHMSGLKCPSSKKCANRIL